MITSSQNPKIRLIRSLAKHRKERREANAFIVEGVRLVEEAVISNWKFQFALYDESLNERGKSLVKRLKSHGIEIDEISENLMKSLSDTETPPGILAALSNFRLPIPDSLNFILIPDQIRDPGNLGTLLRSAAASGVQAVLLPVETTDAFSPKVIRSGMGAHFRLPIHSMTWDEIEKICKSANLQIFLADANGKSCWEVDFRQPLVLIVGSEAEGASQEAHKLAAKRISIPMSGKVESLNAGVAGSILMFEVGRQRK